MKNGSRSHVRPRAIKVAQVVPHYAIIRFPEHFRGSVENPRIIYHPVIVKSAGTTRDRSNPTGRKCHD
jgi:hypothetical protein